MNPINADNNYTFFQCTLPFVGDGVRCTLDSDGDLYPDVALQSPACSEPEGPSEFYCTQVAKD